jgi:hypothetical protein
MAAIKLLNKEKKMTNLEQAVQDYAVAVAEAWLCIKKKEGQKYIENALRTVELSREVLKENGVSLPIGVPTRY